MQGGEIKSRWFIEQMCDEGGEIDFQWTTDLPGSSTLWSSS